MGQRLHTLLFKEDSGHDMPISGLRTSVLYVAVLVVGFLTFSIAHAENPTRGLNSRVFGDLQMLVLQEKNAQPSACDAPPCDHPMKPVHLTVASPRTGRVRITLTSQRVSGAASAREQKNPPLIFRGSVRSHSHAQSGAEHGQPALAVLYRDSLPYTLEISILGGRSHHRRSSMLSVTSMRLGNLTQKSSRNARARASSRHHTSLSRCNARALPEATGLERSHGTTSPLASKGRYKVIFIATDYDSNYAQQIGCSTQRACKNRIIGSVAQASLIYEATFGIVLEVARQYGPTRLTSSSDSSVLLGKFVDFNNQYRASVIHNSINAGDDLVDLFALFTGKSLEEDVNGLTYLSIACRDEFSEVASLLVQHTSDTLDPVIIAHHVGHTLSASHADSGVMTASISEPAPSSFDPKSKVEISGYLSTFYPSCRGGTSNGAMTPTPTPSPTPTPDPYAGVPRTLQLSAKKLGQKTVELSTTISALEPNCIITIRASGRKSTSQQGQLLRQFTPANLTAVFRTTLTAGVDTTTTRNPLIHFFAEYRCADNRIVEVSEIRRLNPNLPRLPSELITKSEWIKRLRRAL